MVKFKILNKAELHQLVDLSVNDNGELTTFGILVFCFYNIGLLGATLNGIKKYNSIKYTKKSK